MSFQHIITVEKADFYIDLAFAAATKKGGSVKSKHHKMPKAEVIRKVELTKMGTVNRSVADSMTNIIKSFPRIDALNPFYFELMKCTLDVGALKKALGALGWIIRKADEMTSNYIKLLNRNDNAERMMQIRREYYGRISSLFRQTKHVFTYLMEARRVIKNYPVVKEMPTVAICGFPNIGKSTLLSKLTGSKPEIANYSFTTKSLNLGYTDINGEKMQFLDTPGTLNRFEKMNYIEMQAYLAAKYCAHVLIYIFDLTEPYPLSDQFELLRNLRTLNKPIIVYLSKTDILPKEVTNDFKKDKDVITDITTLKGRIHHTMPKFKKAEVPKEEFEEAE
ncbi:MAG: GTPase [Candidatus Woesearchaeota archaeon]